MLRMKNNSLWYYVIGIWTTEKGINGYRFTDIATKNTVFFPAAGERGFSNGWLYSGGDYYYYWNSMPMISYAHYLYFGSDGAYVSDTYRTFGFSVRCILE